MANLPETPVWETGIYQLEETDPVQGGPNGIDNQQGKQLANRTRYLKGLVESLGTGKLDLAALATQAEAIAGTDNTKWMTPLRVAQAIVALASMATATETTAGKVELATVAETITGTDTVRATHPAGVKAAISAAVTSLVNASPTTLDTINELAAALGNDPNFSTTIINAIGAKAPLLSPVFSGSPTAPTPEQFASNGVMVNAEFVQRAIGNRSGDIAHLGSENIAANTVGKTIIGSCATPFTLFLPLISAVPTGGEFEVLNFNTGDLTLQRTGADVIYVGGVSMNSIVIKPGCSLRVISSNGAWCILNDDAGLSNSPLLDSYIAASGYKKIPDKNSPTGFLIFQWGRIANASRPVDGTALGPISFPVAFPNAVMSINAQMIGGEGVALTQLDGYLFVKAVGLSSFNLISSFSIASTFEFGAYWFAIGY